MRVFWALLVLVTSTASVAQATGVNQEAEKPLPPLRDLLLDLDRNEKLVEARALDYTYHVHIEEQDFDSKGNVKKTGSTDAESLTINGVRVNRLVARNGKPLTDDEARKESERIDKEVAKAKERREKNRSRGEDTNSRGDVLIPVSRILELGAFTNPRRELLMGRPAIVLDYAGDPAAKTHGPAEGIIRDLVGTVWVDEADRVLVRGEGRFLNDFRIGGGLLINIHKGFSFDFQASKVNGEAWLPASFSGRGSARVLLFKGVNGSLRATMSDYRKFRTGVTVQPASHVLGEDGRPLPEQPVPQPTQPEQPGNRPQE